MSLSVCLSVLFALCCFQVVEDRARELHEAARMMAQSAERERVRLQDVADKMLRLLSERHESQIASERAVRDESARVRQLLDHYEVRMRPVH